MFRVDFLLSFLLFVLFHLGFYFICFLESLLETLIVIMDSRRKNLYKVILRVLFLFFGEETEQTCLHFVSVSEIFGTSDDGHLFVKKVFGDTMQVASYFAAMIDTQLFGADDPLPHKLDDLHQP